MVIAVVSDTHVPRGNRRIPDEVVERAGAADLVVHAGDFTDGSTLKTFEDAASDLRAVHGNMDQPDVFKRLPDRLHFEVEGVAIGVVHDPGPRDGRIGRLRRRFPDCDAVIFGHTHQPQHDVDGDFQIFNPGSPTEHRGHWHAHTMGLATVSGGGIEFELVELD